MWFAFVFKNFEKKNVIFHSGCALSHLCLNNSIKALTNDDKNVIDAAADRPDVSHKKFPKYQKYNIT